MIEFISNYGSWFWLGVMVVCCLYEAATMALTTVWAAIAAFPLIFISRTSLDVKWQLLIFAVLTFVLIIFTRPFAVKKLKVGKSRTNVNTMEGEEVLIVKAVSKFQKGEAKAKNGVVWTAKSATEEEIPEGQVCRIVAVEGNTITVEKIS